MCLLELLKQQGNQLRMPRSRTLGEGLFELRIPLANEERRITYRFASARRIVLLTTFRKQRQVERREIDRAREALHRSVASDEGPGP